MPIREDRGLPPVLRASLEAMSRGRIVTAVEGLRSFVDGLSVKNRCLLSKSLYWLGVCLLRDGHRAAALRSLASAQRLVKRGHSRSLYLRFSNGYGMPRLATSRDDDRAAFQSVQLSRYLSRRPRRSFASACERDVIMALIEDAWSALERRNLLAGRQAADKLSCFKAVRIVFPMPGPERAFEAADIAVDFRSGNRVSRTELCPCGSGLSFLRCCGRNASLAETERGFF